MQSRVKRALTDLQYVLRDLLNALCHSPTVHWAEGKRLQNQQIQRSLQ
jgi:hypothetical protein